MINRLAKFTVVIPVYNGETYITEAIDSILLQSYPHFEIVVLENSSTDKTVEIIQSYTDPRIRMFSSDKILPIEQNWERILDIEDPNEFLVLMCADDILFPTFLEEIAQLINAEPEATLYHSHAVFINDDSKVVGTAKPSTYTETADEFLTALHSFQEDVFGTGFVMRYSDFQKIGGFPKFKRLLFADFYCYYSLTKLGYKACVQSQLAGFRLNTQSVTSKSVLNEFVLASSQYKEALFKEPTLVDKGLLTQFVHRFLLTQYRRYLINLIKNKQNFDEENFQENKQQFLLEPHSDKAFDYDFPISWYVRLAENPIWVFRISVLCCLLAGIYIRKRMMSE